MTDTFSEMVYLPRFRPGGHAAGAHRGRDAGGLGTYRDTIPFLRLPDARRIDIRATMRDPFEGTHVRRFEARTALEVWALVDLSASMRFRGEADRPALVRAICSALAVSATRIGDAFGLVGGDAAIREETLLPPTRRLGLALAHAARLPAFACEGRGADGLVEAARRLGPRPKLVFVVSDFRWPDALIGVVFAALALHDAVPILLADPAEDAGLPAFGLMEIEDREGAGRRTVLLRPSLRRRWQAAERARIATLARLVAPYARPPFRVAERFDPEALSRHLMTT